MRNLCKAIIPVIRPFLSVSKSLFYVLLYAAETGTLQTTFLLCQWLFVGMPEGDAKAGGGKGNLLLSVYFLVLSPSP